MRPPCVVVRGIRDQHIPEMVLSEDEHAVGEFGPGGQSVPSKSWGYAGISVHAPA
jgi:hypothetical protein